MKLQEFEDQDTYCRESNIPGGRGCDGCPALDKEHCADALRNLCGKWLASRKLPDKERKVGFYRISKELERDYGLTFWNQLALLDGGIEFSE